MKSKIIWVVGIIVLLLMVLSGQKQMKKNAGETIQVAYNAPSHINYNTIDMWEDSISQSFTATTDFVLTNIKIYGWQSGNPPPLTLELRDALEGNLLATSTPTSIGSSPSWTNILMSSVSIHAGTKYYIIYKATCSSSQQYSFVRNYNEDPDYPQGECYSHSAYWYPFSQGDFYFEVWGITTNCPTYQDFKSSITSFFSSGNINTLITSANGWIAC